MCKVSERRRKNPYNFQISFWKTFLFFKQTEISNVPLQRQLKLLMQLSETLNHVAPFCQWELDILAHSKRSHSNTAASHNSHPHLGKYPKEGTNISSKLKSLGHLFLIAPPLETGCPITKQSYLRASAFSFAFLQLTSALLGPRAFQQIHLLKHTASGKIQGAHPPN